MNRTTRALQALLREIERLNGCSRCVGPSTGVDSCHALRGGADGGEAGLEGGSRRGGEETELARRGRGVGGAVRGRAEAHDGSPSPRR